jgi:hypothetical protein
VGRRLSCPRVLPSARKRQRADPTRNLVQIGFLDDMLRPYLVRAQLSRADPALDGLGITADALRRLRQGDHVVGRYNIRTGAISLIGVVLAGCSHVTPHGARYNHSVSGRTPNLLRRPDPRLRCWRAIVDAFRSVCLAPAPGRCRPRSTNLARSLTPPTLEEAIQTALGERTGAAARRLAREFAQMPAPEAVVGALESLLNHQH